MALAIVPPADRGATGHQARALTFEDVLRQFGPHVNNGGPPENDEALIARLDACGVAARPLPRTQRAFLVELWTDYLGRELVPAIPNAWRVVRQAFEVAADATVRSWHWFTAAELAALPAPEELVHGHLPAGGLTVLYGPRGLGKTFLALDLACTLDARMAWHGYATHGGAVAYVLAEGRGGLAQRIAAWQHEHGATAPAVRFLTHAVRLLEPGDVEHLVTDLTAGGDTPVLVVLDTLARCLAPGDENSTRDVSAAVAALDRVREATGASVLALHHTGHDKTRERGSTALGAAADTVLALSRETDVLRLSCEKQRDAAEFAPLCFRLHPCAGSVVPRPVLGADPGGLTAADRKTLDALLAISVEEGVPTSIWDLACDEMAHSQFYRSRKKLVDLGLVRVEQSGRQVRYWPAIAESENTPSSARSHEVPF